MFSFSTLILLVGSCDL